MKKILLSFLFVQFSIVSYCQLDKKTWLLGGSGNFSAKKDTRSNATFYQEADEITIIASPNIGYFIADKFVIGIAQNFSWYKSNITTVGGLNTSNLRYDIGPSLRYYLLNKEKSYNLFADANYMFGSYKLYEIKGNRKTYTLKIGTSIFLNESVALDFAVGYNSMVEKVPQILNNTEKGLIVGIGFQFHLIK